MTSRENIPYLLKLMDDESDVVRTISLKELRDFGDVLRDELEALPAKLAAPQIESILDVVEASSLTGRTPIFDIGQMVRHSRYGYRGVIVAYDEICQADEAWYHQNQTQPDRNQPWYHILVSDSDRVTYPAESSLMRDDSTDEIMNPLVPAFFLGLCQGRYVRNSEPWPPSS